MKKFDKIYNMLPQTQCKRCGYSDCKPYAEAIFFEKEDINRCPPGGNTLMEKLADYMGLEKKPINPQCGTPSEPKLLFIDEVECIGCGLCIPSCPVDAIAGAFKFMHTIIKEECTGCELCISPCPVDCIKIIDRPLKLSWNKKRAENSRLKFERKKNNQLKNHISTPSMNHLDNLKKKYIKNEL